MNFKNFKNFITIIFLLVALAAPLASFAFHKSGHDSLVPECTNVTTVDNEGKKTTECVWGWNEAMLLVSSIINFLLFYISLPLAALLFAYAGFIHMTAGDNVTERTKAWNIFKNVGKGLIIALAAWLIVSTILSGLGVKEGFILLKGIKPK